MDSKNFPGQDDHVLCSRVKRVVNEPDRGN